MKVEHKVYLPPELSKALDELAARTRRPKSEIVRAAVASFLSPDGAERNEAALVRRLDRLSRLVEKSLREGQTANAALGIFIQAWFQSVPPVSEEDRPAAKARANRRYEEFLGLLPHRVARVHSLSEAAFQASGDPPPHGESQDA